jgi:hypothetical protein
MGIRFTEEEWTAFQAKRGAGKTVLSKARVSNKYGAKRVEIDGYKFDSKREAERYQELKLLEKTTKLHLIEVHPKFEIEHNGVKICKVILDFWYCDNKDGGIFIYEDVKGMDTPVSRLKRKLVKAFYKIDVTVVK